VARGRQITSFGGFLDPFTIGTSSGILTIGLVHAVFQVVMPALDMAARQPGIAVLARAPGILAASRQPGAAMAGSRPRLNFE
jgi:hypothetical protein